MAARHTVRAPRCMPPKKTRELATYYVVVISKSDFYFNIEICTTERAASSLVVVICRADLRTKWLGPINWKQMNGEPDREACLQRAL